MAAYATLVSLMNIMDQIQRHRHHPIPLDKKQIKSLREKLDFLLDFVENYSHGGSKETEVLESQIAAAACVAEDVIESFVVDQILAAPTKGHHRKQPVSWLDLRNIIKKMDSIKEKVMKVKEERKLKDLQSTYSMLAASSRSLKAGNNTMVGFKDNLLQLMDELTGQQSKRLVIPIVGMGGIGKTTLSRNVYENSFVTQHFDIRAWGTVSQEYSVREILLELLSCQKKSTSQMDRLNEDQLGDQLYKSLSGRRYFIILDDLWSVEAWDEIKMFLPDNMNRSRIVVTTRLSNVATHFNSTCHVMSFLDEDISWELFCQNAFPQEGCPPELEGIGKKIVRKCKGLPLSIVVIGGLLGKSYRAQEYWESVAIDIHPILNSGDVDNCLGILSLSYSHLPAHLKSCFLYMGVFPEDREINVSRLIKLWVAEGFLKPSEDHSLEEVAEHYVRDLIDRNLILVRKLGSNGKIKTCSIHDLLRDICLTVAEKEKFLCVMRVRDIPQGIDRERRLVFHTMISNKNYNRRVSHALQSASLARSLTCELDALSFKFRLLRVLNVVHIDTLEATLQHVNLRYLACVPFWLSNFELPSSISLLWNVQTLIVRGGYERFIAPSEIWNMPQLRHVEFDEISLPDPEKDGFVLLNMQTLKRVVNFRLSEMVCKRVPNVKKLHIIYDDFSSRSDEYFLNNLGRLSKLESLNCSFEATPCREDLLLKLKFPSSLQQLSLRNSNLHWEDLTMIGSLPHLEVLKLDRESVTGSEWNPVEGEFLRLKFLKISFCCDLVNWNADSFHFPVLENLVLEGLPKLDEIPSGIGEIQTLQVIHLDECCDSAAISTMKILEELESLGNEGLQVRVYFWKMAKAKKLRDKLEKTMSFTSNNFQLTSGLY